MMLLERELSETKATADRKQRLKLVRNLTKGCCKIVLVVNFFVFFFLLNHSYFRKYFQMLLAVKEVEI